MRSLLRSVINADPRLEVVGSATDGAAALDAISTLAPDLVLLDVEMPGMDGLTTLKRLRTNGCRVPVIMCSSLTMRGARVTIEALANGAADYVAKPAGQQNREQAARTLSQELIPKIHALVWAPRCQQPPVPNVHSGSHFAPVSAVHSSVPPSIVAIGVSTGGPAALDQVLPFLPADFHLPVVVVQHMPEIFTGQLAERLNERCGLRVMEAAEGNAITPGKVLIARGNWHMEVTPHARPALDPVAHLTQAAPENHCRPSVDVLFRSLAAVYCGRVLAIVLTGMGSDGLAGCRLLRSQGATVLAQDEATSAVWGMPGAVAMAGLAHRVMPLNAIAPEILRLSARSSNEARATRQTVV